MSSDDTPAEPLPRVQCILFPTDFTEGCYAALPWAQLLAQAEDAKIHLLHVVEEIPAVPEMGMYYQGGIFQPEIFLEAAQARLELEQKRFDTERRPVHIEVRLGAPAAQIDAYAREIEADMIVMASHQPGFFERCFRGSVSAGTVNDAPCPVLVVPAQASAS